MVTQVLTAEVLIHEVTGCPGTYWILYGDKVFQWHKNPDKDCQSKLLRQAGTGHHFVIVKPIWSLDCAVEYIKATYDSGLTVAPPSDRRKDR